MRYKTLIIYFNFFVTTFSYYGLALNMGDVTGGSNIFLNFTISSLLEIPAYTAAIVILLYFGRRMPYALSLFLCGVSLIITVAIPRGYFPNDWPVVAVTLLGKSAITFSFGVIFLYTAELFPTEVRTSGIGSANFVGKDCCKVL